MVSGGARFGSGRPRLYPFGSKNISVPAHCVPALRFLLDALLASSSDMDFSNCSLDDASKILFKHASTGGMGALAPHAEQLSCGSVDVVAES